MARATKRAYGSGTVRCRGKRKTWEIIYRTEPGAPAIYEKVGSEIYDGVTKKDAEALLLQRIAQVQRGEAAELQDQPFRAIAEEWRRTQEALDDLSPRTLEMYDHALKHLIPAFDISIHLIDPALIENYISKKLTLAPIEKGAPPVDGEIASQKTKPIGRRSLEQQLSVLRQIFDFAITRKKTSSNPAKSVKLRRGREKFKSKEPLEAEEIKALLENSLTEENETFILLLASTGIRIGEALGLLISDYDPATKVLTIQRTQSRRNGKVFLSEFPKTDAGVRDLQISEDLHRRLIRQIARAKIRTENEKEKLLFPNTRGRHLSHSNFISRVWKPSLQRAGLSDDYTPHRLRHTFASEQIAKGTEITALSWWLGHSSPAVTQQIYTRAIKSQKSKSLDLSGLYSEKEEKVSEKQT